jgi:hypothetical protein
MGTSRVSSDEFIERPPDRRREPARVVALASYRRRVVEAERDRALHAEWDRLAVLVAEASCWRDPDSVAAVEDCVARLKRLVREDWG